METNQYKESKFLSEYYDVVQKTIRHFNLILGYAVIAKRKSNGEIYYALNKDDNGASHDLFMQLPDSAIREGSAFIDGNDDIWTVKWYCGEKVQLIKEKNVVLNGVIYQEELMVYIYKGIEYMSFDYRLHTEDGTRVSYKVVPFEYKPVLDDVVELSMREAKYSELLLKKPVLWKQFKDKQ